MATAGDLIVNLSANTSKFNSGIKKAQAKTITFQGAVKKMGSSIVSIFSSTGAKIAALTGAWFSIAAVKSFVSAAQTQIQANAKLGAVLKATGGAAGFSAKELTQYASELQSVTNYGDEATIGGMAILATFKDIQGEAFKGATRAALDLSSVMGQDLNSSIVQIGKALNDPIRGVTALTRVGVSFTAQQKMQIRTLQESGDLLGAQKIILEELKSEFGGAAAAMADPFTQVSNKLGDVYEEFGLLAMTIGKEFLPAANQLIDWAQNIAIKFNALPDKLGFMREALPAVFDLAFETIKSKWATMLDEMVKMSQDALISMGKHFAVGGEVGAGVAKRLEAKPVGGDALQQAQARVDKLMQQFNGNGLQGMVGQAGKVNAAPPQAKKAMGGLFTDIAGTASDLFDRAKVAGQAKLTDLGIKGNYIASVVKNMFTGEGEEGMKAKAEVRTAGAMGRGSAEAFSTIVQAMLGSQQDPNVKATEKQTKQLVKAIGKQKPPQFNVVEAFG